MSLASLPADPLQLGALVASRYELKAVLGRGASGVVYSAVDGDSGVEVALKVIHREHCHTRQIFARYKREAAILRQIGGEHIVRFLDFIEHDGLLVIVLELVRGVSLEHRLQQGPIEIEAALEIATQICIGLETAHQAGVVHRDLKPGNVMVETAANGMETARILDFGLAKVVHGGHLNTGLTERDMIFGTPEYMAPEQARGDDADVRSDVYACGVILYEMLTGSVPFRGKTPLATMTAVLSQPLDPPRSRAKDRAIPSVLETVLLRCLEKSSEDRYTSVRELRAAIEAASERRVISLQPTPRSDLHDSDTELSLRRSQIRSATEALRAAEALAEAKARLAEGDRPTELAPPPTPAGAPNHLEQRWKFVAAAAIVTCIVLGVLLALK